MNVSLKELLNFLRTKQGRTMLKNFLKFFVLGIGAGIVLVFALAVPLFFLWNWLMPGLFELPSITYLESWGLLMMVYIVAFILNGSRSNEPSLSGIRHEKQYNLT